MVELAEALEDRGMAYATDARNVYYAVGAFADYGRLSGNSLDDLRAGHRGEVEPDKRDPADFALWKAAGARRSLKWPTTRWGDGFPGWHLECSAMARRYLGDRFDLHTGGIDNIFPHHEDEIAQSAPLVGGPPARIWVHGEHLLMAGRKMAKSAGNFQRVTELADEGIDPLAFRYLVLTSRYGASSTTPTTRSSGAAAALASLRARLAALGPPPAEGRGRRRPVLSPAPRAIDPRARRRGAAGLRWRRPTRITDRAHAPVAPLSPEGRTLHDRFVAALDDDLDLPAALVTVREILRADLPEDERRWLVARRRCRPRSRPPSSLGCGARRGGRPRGDRGVAA